MEYRGKRYGWDVVIRLKAQELANYLLGRRTELDFTQPFPILSRDDTALVRERILSMTAAEARRSEIGKSTLWYLKERAGKDRPFKIHRSVRNRIS